MHDIVDVQVSRPGEPPGTEHRAKVVGFTNTSAEVVLGNKSVPHFVHFKQIRRRVVLPWRPQDLHNNLIILRRRGGSSDEYVEDLRVRRDRTECEELFPVDGVPAGLNFKDMEDTDYVIELPPTTFQ